MRWVVVIYLLFLPVMGLAQEEDDKGMLTRFLESSLSGAGRSVEVVGLRGAISSEATIEEIRISDDDGLWITLSKIKLNWNRLAVLRGNVNVNELSADRIVLVRLPKTTPDPEAPTAEATPFSLPELPVSINIQKLSAGRIELGEPVLGQEAVLSLETKLVLLEGDGEAILEATRIEGPSGKFHLDAAFSNATGQLRVDLEANEADDGIVASLIRLPGTPAIDLSIKGEGPLDDFTADIRLASAGEERLAGQVILSTEEAETAETPATQVILADISGDMAPLFAPEYRDFFGTEIALNSLVHLYANGETTLDNLSLTTASMALKGAVSLSSDGLPDKFDVTLKMADPSGKPVLLPVAGARTLLKRADLTAEFDAAKGERWALSGIVEGFDTDTVNLGRAAIAANGLIRRNTPTRVSAALRLDMDSLKLADPALDQAIGSSGQLTGNVLWEEGADIQLSDFEMAAGGLLADGKAAIGGLGNDLSVDGRLRILAPDITRFSGLAARPLSGELLTIVEGSFAPLTGAFDADITARGRDLTINDPRFDRLARGQTVLAFSGKRDFDGLNLRHAALDTDGFDITVKGDLDSNNGNVTLAARLEDTAVVLEGVSGPSTIDGTATLTNGDWSFDVKATAPGETVATVDGGVPASGPMDASIDMTVGQLETFLDALPGQARIQADTRQLETGWKVDLTASGPFETQATGSGVIDIEGNNSLFDLTGSLPLAIANRQLAPNSVQGLATYELRLEGVPALENVSGTVRTAGARFSLPSLRASLDDINSTITLANGAAGIAATTAFSGGGTISVDGSVGLSAPFNANLPIRVSDLAYRDGQLLETVVDGMVQVAGPLTGGGTISGDLVLGQTNIRIASAALAGVGDVPEIAHVGEPASAQRTRANAGLIKEETGKSNASAPFSLDLRIRTGERISVRGMGLNADFDGGMTIAGTTNNLDTQGQLELIRGRMAFLTKTFDIDEGLIRLEGDLIPWMRVQATSKQTDATVRVILEGRLDDPEIILESEPELPEDEVLSQLLFGRDLSSISGLQAAQLAAALASLSGNGPGRPRLGRNTGLDELALTFDESGTPGLRAGKYINENVYTEVGVDSEGKSSISLNLDVTESLTVKGRVDSDSDSGIGLFFQKDY
ncbi:translocation/assembly module TamB domain-containing protein [Shimia sp. W99]